MVLSTAISLLGLLAVIAEAASAKLADQGPRSTSMVNGKEVWQLGGRNYDGNVLSAMTLGKVVVVYNELTVPSFAQSATTAR